MEKNDSSQWVLPPARLRLEECSIHVWQAYLPAERSRLSLLINTLSPDEQARADRFRRSKDRISFALTRGILRCVLSRYLGSSPEKIRFDYTSFGKPRLWPNPEESRLNFNLSHSNQWIVLAIGKSRKIGIDVEYIRDDLDYASIARRFFSPQEVDFIESGPEERKQRFFYEIWVRKEAYLKAMGKGLSMPLSGFTVPLGSRISVISYLDADPWLFHGISIDPEYASALVTHAPVQHIRKYHWQS